MDNPLFVVSPLYVVVGLVIVALILHEYLRQVLPTLYTFQRRMQRHAHGAHSPHSHHHHAR
jgi:hypothetical protein